MYVSMHAIHVCKHMWINMPRVVKLVSIELV